MNLVSSQGDSKRVTVYKEKTLGQFTRKLYLLFTKKNTNKWDSIQVGKGRTAFKQKVKHGTLCKAKRKHWCGGGDIAQEKLKADIGQ